MTEEDNSVTEGNETEATPKSCSCRIGAGKKRWNETEGSNLEGNQELIRGGCRRVLVRIERRREVRDEKRMRGGERRRGAGRTEDDDSKVTRKEKRKERGKGEMDKEM